jgi:hypothetical protein
LSDEGKYIADLIYKYAYMYSKKDRRFRNYVTIFKIFIFFLAMCNTIILGISYFSNKNLQIDIGLIISAILTCLTTITAYFNFEHYWMRNRILHIEINIIKEDFIFKAINNKLDTRELMNYFKKLEEIHNKDIKYWENEILEVK